LKISRKGIEAKETGASEENAFKIIKLDENEKRDYLFINSGMHLLYKVREKLIN
jgi:hypothetical protein